MKKLGAVLLVLLMLVGCSTSPKETQKLYIFNWGSYIDESLIKEFEQEHNVKIVYELFDSNESMYLKLVQSSVYDILVPTDYMIERLIKEDRLQKLDYSKLPNYTDALDSLKGRAMDPTSEYTAPYFWGNVGIVYDKTAVSMEDLESQGWNILKNPKYADNIFVLDSERDVFMMALKSLGYSMNTTDPKELEEAYNWLLEMNTTTRPIYQRDEIIDSMVSGVKDIATMYSGDATYVLSQDENLAFYVPTEGTNSWMDAMVITKDSKNAELAHEWINFILSKDSQLRITEEVGYTSSRQDVIDEVTAVGGTYEGIESYTNRQNHPLDENYNFDDATRAILADMWLRVKAND